VDATPNQNDLQAERVWYRFLRLQGRVRVAVGARLKDVGLSIPQCDVLTTLTEREGVSQQELAKHLYVTKGNISGLIDRLEAAALVERRPIAADRRSYSICLTPAGRQAAETGMMIQRQFVADTFGRLSGAELAKLETMLIALRDAVRAGGEGSVAADRSSAAF
jgi:DNA-binding MarR family transcriptional regulator